MVNLKQTLQHQFINNLLKVTLTRSPHHGRPNVRACIATLGLKRINQHRYHKNTAEIRGMIHQAIGYVSVEQLALEKEPSGDVTPSSLSPSSSSSISPSSPAQ
eukprot:TRINITY_DN1828_c0_g1_i1.p1 TRINITY_DN1828_c0_g1~~TRINITY_DN1828_c0_g1_i1.p1  ORF type:complete len:103 (-),score=21.97 TRINITY_DN1828_c0_g1_i1:51-359(-)